MARTGARSGGLTCAAWISSLPPPAARLLRHADLRDAQLQGAMLRSAQLQGADLSGAPELQGANLLNALLQGARLSSADLQGARLSSADLQGAELSDALLQGADLSYAQLRGADLRDALPLQGADPPAMPSCGAPTSAHRPAPGRLPPAPPSSRAPAPQLRRPPGRPPRLRPAPGRRPPRRRRALRAPTSARGGALARSGASDECVGPSPTSAVSTVRADDQGQRPTTAIESTQRPQLPSGKSRRNAVESSGLRCALLMTGNRPLRPARSSRRHGRCEAGRDVQRRRSAEPDPLPWGSPKWSKRTRPTTRNSGEVLGRSRLRQRRSRSPDPRPRLARLGPCELIPRAQPRVAQALRRPSHRPRLLAGQGTARRHAEAA